MGSSHAGLPQFTQSELMLPITLRGYQANDLDALEALDAVCFTPAFRFSRAAMRRFAEARNALVCVACELSPGGAAGPLAGFCIVHLERAPDGSSIGYVVTLDVDPRSRGQGLGVRLMEALESLATERGAASMMLHVSVSNPGAIRLYERLGYRRTGLESRFYGGGGDALVYRKSL